MGYSESSKSYRIYLPGFKNIDISRDVKFDEDFVISDFTTPGESHLYGLPMSLCRLLSPLGPFFVL